MGLEGINQSFLTIRLDDLVTWDVDHRLTVRFPRHGTFDVVGQGFGHVVLVHSFTNAVVSHGAGKGLASQAGRETGSSIWIPAPSPGRRRI